MAKPWCRAVFAQRHALLAPILDAYLAARPKGPSSLESFLHAFYLKEAQCAHTAVGAAAEFLLMEHWRELWRTREQAGVLPAERRAARALMDPILQESSSTVAQDLASKHWHRESVEFADAVVSGAVAMLSKKRRDAAASESVRHRAVCLD